MIRLYINRFKLLQDKNNQLSLSIDMAILPVRGAKVLSANSQSYEVDYEPNQHKDSRLFCAGVSQ